MYRTGFIDQKNTDFTTWSRSEGLGLCLVDGHSCLALEPESGSGQGPRDGKAPVLSLADRVAPAGLAVEPRIVAQADSPVLEAKFPLSAAIPSWCAETPEGSWMELLLRVRRGASWSGWFSLGLWASGEGPIQRQSVTGQQEEGARVDTDTLRLDLPAEALQIRLILASMDPKALPIVRRICLAYSDPKPGSAARDSKPRGSVLPVEPNMTGPEVKGGLAGRSSWSGELSGVPRCSQMVYPDGGKVWCSPTCVAMILGYWKKIPGPWESGIRQAVAGTYDHVYQGHGNWAFNTAYAASQGFDACVARLPSLDSLEPWLAAGVPVALSVSWNNDEGRVLSGAPIASSSGHLTLLVGFDEAGDPIMHEPASPSDEYVRRTYRREELEERWLAASGGACYLIHPLGQAVPILS